ncbi:MAG: hypothetical protein OQK45_06325, partial [Sulfurovum sp.]|nr:hypothetical protein [Sulfurovum sp.]
MKFIQLWLRAFSLFSFLVLGSGTHLQAEGSWQMGLKEGSTHNQPLLDYYSYAQSDQSGLTREYRPLYVDILNANEVINVHACGNADADNLRILIFDDTAIPGNDTTGLIDSTTITGTGPGWIACNNTFGGT